MSILRTILLTILTYPTLMLLSGCGEEHENNVPAVKLTASTVVSQSATAPTSHSHTVEIPFSDISAAPSQAVYQYRSSISATDSHSHVIALSTQQMSDLNNGMQLTLLSSAPDSGTPHTHTWSVQGGTVLYDKHCYNCHTNDTRNRWPMNVPLNQTQAEALRSPVTAPSSTTTPAVADATFIPTSTLNLNGASLYAGYCEGCHQPLAASQKRGATTARIKDAISKNTGNMAQLSTLTDAQLAAIAAQLQ